MSEDVILFYGVELVTFFHHAKLECPSFLIDRSKEGGS
jgi:hypothetical protein